MFTKDVDTTMPALGGVYECGGRDSVPRSFTNNPPWDHINREWVRGHAEKGCLWSPHESGGFLEESVGTVVPGTWFLVHCWYLAPSGLEEC